MNADSGMQKTGKKKADPLAILLDLEKRSREHAAGLPFQTEKRDLWSGIGFQVQNLHFVAPLDEVAEILYHPEISRVPGVQSWIKGIANVRGNLLPIIDLQDYLGGKSTTIHRRSRVMVIHQYGLEVGLLVVNLFGMKRFFYEDKNQLSKKYTGVIDQYVEEEFCLDDERWGVFSMAALSQHESFIKASL